MAAVQESHRPHRTSGRALLIAAHLPEETDAELTARCSELERLANTLGLTVVGRETQRRPPSTQTFLGSGRLEALAAFTAPEEGTGEADLVLVDASLTPRQLRALQRALKVEVLDRPSVILEIFAQRAGTRQAQLEVELARLRYLLPRLRDVQTKQGRTGGGGRGERGHTNVELEKARVRERIARLQRELDAHQARAESRQRHREGVFQAALVGYTNAGKSTVMEALSGREAGAEDKLFATLGTRIRQLQPPMTPPILVSDTVGFIRDLPHELVASFRSTLDEALQADLLLLMVDASDPDWRAQLRVTRETLADIGAGALPARVVLNKTDRLPPEAIDALRGELPDALTISAVRPDDVARLRDAVTEARDLGLCEETVVVPWDQGTDLGAIHSRSVVVDQQATSTGQLLRLRASGPDLDRWHPSERTPLSAPQALIEEAVRLGLQLQPAGPPDDSGLDFRVLPCVDEAGQRWMLRAPRRPDVMDSARMEGRALRLVRGRLPVAVPDWKVHSPRLLAYPALPGTPGWTVVDGSPRWNGLDPAAPSPRFLRSVAHALAALQAVPEWAVRAAGLPVLGPEAERARRRERLEAVREVLQPGAEVLARWERWLDRPDGWPPFSALVHGDLHPGHMLLDEDLELVGLLDWTEARVADPARDLAVMHGCFGGAVVQRMIGALEAAGARTWPGMAAHVAAVWDFHAVEAAWWGLKHDQPEVLAHARSLVAASG